MARVKLRSIMSKIKKQLLEKCSIKPKIKSTYELQFCKKDGTNNQTICWFLPMNCSSVFDYFWGWHLKELSFNKSQSIYACKHSPYKKKVHVNRLQFLKKTRMPHSIKNLSYITCQQHQRCSKPQKFYRNFKLPAIFPRNWMLVLVVMRQ